MSASVSGDDQLAEEVFQIWHRQRWAKQLAGLSGSNLTEDARTTCASTDPVELSSMRVDSKLIVMPEPLFQSRLRQEQPNTVPWRS